MTISDGQLTSLALCWRIERADGCGLALTSHDRVLTRDGVTYRPAPGMSPASISRSLGLAPNDGEVAGAISSAALSSTDLAMGRLDGASIALEAVDWTDPEGGAIALLGGAIGAVTVRDNAYVAALDGATRKLDRPPCPATSAECRASFGDQHCRVDLAGRTAVATVISASGVQLSLDRVVDDQWVFGRLVYLSGANCGRRTIVIAAGGTTITVRDLPRGPVEAGTRVELRHGCDKSFATCAGRFANAANFRGEPHLPGNDLLTRYPGA